MPKQALCSLQGTPFFDFASSFELGICLFKLFNNAAFTLHLTLQAPLAKVEEADSATQ